MKKIKYLVISCIITASLSVLTSSSVFSQQSGITRTTLQQHDLSVEGREVVQATIEFAPGAEAEEHNHPGEEIIYVIEGVIEYKVGGKPVILKAGEVLFIRAGTVHSARNTGSSKAIELATYVVEKDKPLISIVK